MKREHPQIDLRMNRFTEACRASGAKLTPQRLEIFREVAKASDHPDVEMIFQRVRRRMPTVALDTVYRTLWWLKDLGLVAILGPPRKRTRFDANLEQHHHFTCVRCGLTQDFYSDRFNELNLPESVRSIGRVETLQVEVKGLCRDCVDKVNQESEKTRRKQND